MARETKNSECEMRSGVTISREEAIVRQALETPNPDREPMIEALERSVQDGSYQPDASSTAAAFLAEAHTRFLEERIIVSRITAQKTMIWLTELEETLRQGNDTDGADDVASVRDDIFRSWRMGVCAAP